METEQKYYIQTSENTGFYLETPPAFRATYETFFNSYQIQGIALAPPTKSKMISPPKERACRFCGQSFPIVTFRNDAHIIPESLGNRYLVSEYECDDCNAKFGKLDDQLIKWLGVNRSLNGTKGKAKTKHPNYQSADQKVTVRHQPFFGDESAISIQLAESGNGALFSNRSPLSQTMKLVKSPYVPLMAYLSLIKMALCILPEEEVINYRRLINLLNKYKRSASLTVSGAKVSACWLPVGYGYEYPRMILYKKRDLNDLIQAHTTVLYTRNLMIQVWLPLHLHDHFNETQIPILPPVCPPLFFGSHNDLNFPVKTAELDLSSNEVKKGEEEELHWGFSSADMDNAVSFDRATGKPGDQPFNFDEVKQIILSYKEFDITSGEDGGAV